jgi:hypothetical protein
MYLNTNVLWMQIKTLRRVYEAGEGVNEIDAFQLKQILNLLEQLQVNLRNLTSFDVKPQPPAANNTS